MAKSANCMLPLVLLSLVGCGDRSYDHATEAQIDVSSSVVKEVEAAVWRFHAADTARNAEAVIGLLWPEFYMLADGSRDEYERVVAGTRRFMESLALFETRWTDVRVTPLGPDHAVSSFAFRDSIVTRSGELIQARGPTTLVWERRGDEWRVLYADADHYPVDK